MKALARRLAAVEYRRAQHQPSLLGFAWVLSGLLLGFRWLTHGFRLGYVFACVAYRLSRRFPMRQAVKRSFRPIHRRVRRLRCAR